MAAFAFKHSPFLLDPVFFSTKMSSLLEEGDMDTCFSTYQPEPLYDNPVDVRILGSNCLYNNSDTSKSINEPPVTEKSKTDSSSMVFEFDSDDHKEASMEKKRKTTKDGSCLSSAQSQDMRGVKAKKQKKCSNRKEETEEKKSKAFKKDQKKVQEEPPAGYIHVRARRGQATDSHSLAERVRREKISERMRLLQGLVPGCDKVTGKALMLDEIINYVQSLQYQVEFLSMKLASVNPVLHDFGADMNALLIKAETGSESQLPSMNQTNLTQSINPADATATLTTKSNYFHQDNAVSFLPQQGQMQGALSQTKVSQSIWLQQLVFFPIKYHNNNPTSICLEGDYPANKNNNIIERHQETSLKLKLLSKVSVPDWSGLLVLKDHPPIIGGENTHRSRT
ncbi:hypothetical protein IFM89_032239 [Coptis chinensis]|uniref:BHLH domain-containing protein n=1 Tax=Coptis chinensis TaxID=261450 RepID=A0A835I130_9MAGN|nr:hypothetical protein IFM89_032239 [Coptis chinensis]